MVSPKDSGFQNSRPCGQRSRIRASGKYPWCLVRPAAANWIKRGYKVFGEIRKVFDRVLQSQMLQILHCQEPVWRGLPPIPVFQNYDGTTELSGEDPSESLSSKEGGVESVAALFSRQE